MNWVVLLFGHCRNLESGITTVCTITIRFHMHSHIGTFFANVMEDEETFFGSILYQSIFCLATLF